MARATGGARTDPYRLLIVDADQTTARLLAANLGLPARLSVDTCTTGAEALRLAAGGDCDALVTGLSLPDMDGAELVRRLHALNPALPVVLLARQISTERTVEAVRAGATEVLSGPPNATVLRATLERLLPEQRQSGASGTVARSDTEPGAVGDTAHRTRDRAGAEHYLRGDHPRIAAIRAFAEQVARVPDARVLITGETGTGKSRLAHAIHELSGAPGRMVEVNCAALPPQLLESELFGHEPGAFTDARGLKRGLVELADRGTLFLDEIGTMPLELQAKLLLFIERREIRRVGGADTVPVRCRLITATHENLRQRVRERSFRQDLLFRLDVASVEMPPLREMPTLIPEMTNLFVAELAAEQEREPPPLDEASLAVLGRHPWPGNLRELRNAIERALIFHTGGSLTPQPRPASDLADVPGGEPGVVMPLGVSLDELERRYLAAMLERVGPGGLSELASTLGISRKTLWEKRRRYGL